MLEWTEDGAFAAAEEAYLREKEKGRDSERGEMQVTLTAIQQLFADEEIELSISKIREGLRSVNCSPSHRRVHIKDLVQALEQAQQHGTYDHDMAYENPA